MMGTLVSAVLALGSYVDSLAVLGLVILVWDAHNRIDDLEHELATLRGTAHTGGEDP